MKPEAYIKWKFNFLFVIALLTVGFALQLVVGNFGNFLLKTPYNLIAGAVIIFAIRIFHRFFGNGKIYGWLTSYSLNISLLLAFTIMVLISGVVPQDDPFSRSGLRQIVLSWPFALICTFILLTLTAAIFKKRVKFTLDGISFLLIHISVWIILFSTGAGSADRKRYILYAEEGKIIHAAHNYMGGTDYLPITIQVLNMAERRICISGEGGMEITAVTEVNHPLKSGHWAIYLYGEGTGEDGKEYLIMKIVYDPWLTAVYAGFAMLALGAILFVFRAGVKKEEQHGTE
jgi:hypothetical protein